jgi:hypothetical protein
MCRSRKGMHRSKPPPLLAVGEGAVAGTWWRGIIGNEGATRRPRTNSWAYTGVAPGSPWTGACILALSPGGLSSAYTYPSAFVTERWKHRFHTTKESQRKRHVRGQDVRLPRQRQRKTSSAPRQMSLVTRDSMARRCAPRSCPRKPTQLSQNEDPVGVAV